MPIAAPRRALLRAMALGPAMVAAGRAGAQAPYPNRPVRILVGAVAGGATDITARILTEAMAAQFPRGFAIDNRSGAGGGIAAEAAARAAPDGYTLLVNDSAQMAINPVVFRQVPYDPATDFTPIALLADFSFMIAAHPSLPVASFAEFVTWAKAQPAPVQFASPNTGSPHHLGMELLAQRLGFRVQHVGFRGGAQATTALLAGQVPVGSIGLPPLIPHLREGTLRGLAVSGATRSPVVPNVPTLSEAAIPGLSMAVWYGLVGPRGLPPEVVRFVGAAVAETLGKPEVIEKLAAQGLTPRHLPAAAFDTFMAGERTRWGAVARAANVTAD